MNPVTIPADFPDCAWQLVVLAAVVLVLDGAVGMEWLIGETREYGGGKEE
jgi:hypothetical protein